MFLLYFLLLCSTLFALSSNMLQIRWVRIQHEIAVMLQITCQMFSKIFCTTLLIKVGFYLFYSFAFNVLHYYFSTFWLYKKAGFLLEGGVLAVRNILPSTICINIYSRAVTLCYVLRQYKVLSGYNSVGDAAVLCGTAALYTVTPPKPSTGQSVLTFRRTISVTG